VRLRSVPGAVLPAALAFAASASASTPRLAIRSAAPWGVSVGLPVRWRVVVVPKRVTPSFLARAGRRHPPLSATLPAAVRLGVKLVAYEPPPPGAFAPNLNVIVDPFPEGTTLRAWMFQGASAGYVHVGTTTAVRVRGVRGLRYVSTKAVRSGTLPLLTVEYAFARGGRVYLFTFTAPAAKAAAYRPLFDRAARSIRFGHAA